MLKILPLVVLSAFAAHLSAADGPRTVSASEFLGGSVDGRPVSMEAMVADALSDETNPQYVFLVLEANGETIYAPMRCAPEDRPSAERLVGAQIRVTGQCDAFIPEPRRQLGRQLFVAGLDDIAILQPAPSDPFDVPELGDTRLMTPSEISRLDRRRTTGRILASWSDTESLLETPLGRLVHVSFANRPAPKRGTFAEVVGRPVSDVYRVNLERARWRPSAPFDFADTPATNVTARDIMMGAEGQIQIKPQFLGKTIILRGTLRNRNGDTLNVEDGSFIVPVIVTEGDADIETGSVVEATGVCILDIENWRPNAAFPQIDGIFVVCGKGGLRVVSRPPWWTPRRLAAVIAVLIAAIIAALAWNWSLRAQSERRGRELLKARLAGERAALKVAERTRLAAELHDSLSQNLAGVAMGIGVAQRALPTRPGEAAARLEFAARAIDSCREGLKRCLWNLRSSALDEHDLGRAIGISIGTALGGARLVVDFSAPRSLLPDSVADAILRITKELASNAVRHGGASRVEIRGSIASGRLEMSVSDNGRGFDVNSAPGVREGHFGLQGVRELVTSLDGDFSIEGAPGMGCRANVSLPLGDRGRKQGNEEDKSPCG